MILARNVCLLWNLLILTVFDSQLDTAKDIYKNATLEKIALLRFLLVREKSAATNMHAWENHLTVSLFVYDRISTNHTIFSIFCTTRKCKPF
jgi:predicted membrane-bound dolichyl-phosphate-mannose-protein mannosyltransferase